MTDGDRVALSGYMEMLDDTVDLDIDGMLGGEPVRILLADYDRLAAELQAVRGEYEKIHSLLKDVFDHYDVDRFRSARGSAPGHAHATPGIWDEDNGERSGKPCAWCATWSRVKSAVAQQEGGTA